MRRVALAILVLSACSPAAGGDLPGCVDGHPAKRAAHVTYAGLPRAPGYQRDHYRPLELLGADNSANVHYQLLSYAWRKDGDEHKAGSMYCAGLMSLDAAWAWLEARWPIDTAHGYDRE